MEVLVRNPARLVPAKSCICNHGNIILASAKKSIILILKVSKFNAYAIHGSGDQKHYECHKAVTDGSETEPDFHRLQYFAKLDFNSMVPRDLNEEAFKDWKWGDLWNKENR